MQSGEPSDVRPADPKQQLDYLREVLRHDKRPIGLFLGAGCPAAIPHPDDAQLPLIPAVPGLTMCVSDALLKSAMKECFDLVLSHFAEDKVTNPNVEQVLTHVRLLRQVCGCKEARGLTADQLDGVEKAICQRIYEVTNVTLPTRNTPYHQVAMWIASRSRAEPVEVFTTNYDLLMEQALEESRVPYFDGFVGSRMAFFDPTAVGDKVLPLWARLWKLHGSINWRRAPTRRGPVFRVGDLTYKPEHSLVIHPSHLKYDDSRQMPYLALMDRMRYFLAKPAMVVVVVGYSFGDDHLNDVLLQGLERNPDAAAFGLFRGPVAKYDRATAVAGRTPRLTLLAKDGGVVGTRPVRWTRMPRESESGAEEPATFDAGDFRSFGGLLHSLVEASAPRDEATLA